MKKIKIKCFKCGEKIDVYKLGTKESEVVKIYGLEKYSSHFSYEILLCVNACLMAIKDLKKRIEKLEKK